MPAFVAKIRAAVNIRCQDEDKPKIVFVDRGKGFYHPSTGAITDEFKAALHTHGLKAFMRDDASLQPGNLQELFLHETAVAWIRARQKVTTPERPYEETVEQFRERMRELVADINDNHDVEGLRMGFPRRIEKLLERKGDRLDEWAQ
jgi:hypothetical protein